MIIQAIKFVKRYGPHLVFLNGVEMQDVFYIDRRRRTMRMWLRDKQGNIVISDDGETARSLELRWHQRQRLELKRKDQ